MNVAAESLTLIDRRRRWRSIKDTVTRHGVAVGGVSVIFAITLIFFYLLYEVFPLFEGASAVAGPEYPAPGAATAATLYLGMDEQAVVGVRFTDAGLAVAFDTATGLVLKTFALPLDGATVTAFSVVDPAEDKLAFGLSDGRVLIARYGFDISYPGDQRTVAPKLEYPLGETPLVLDARGRALLQVAASFDDNGAMLAGVVAGGETVLAGFDAQTSFLTGETTLREGGSWALAERLPGGEMPEFLLLEPNRAWLYVAGGSGHLMFIALDAGNGPRLVQRVRLVHGNERLTALEFLIGGISVLAGTSEGRVAQWFPVRDADNQYTLQSVREFPAAPAAITAIAPEHRRKGFIVATADGAALIYHSTSNQLLLAQPVSDKALGHVASSPRGNVMLTVDDGGQLHYWTVRNEHPEVSWSTLWGEVWYESYPEPAQIWQSSSASNDFEPKFSLTPLAFGTLKAAFYAMLFAVPLAIMGAIYAAYFMSAELRRFVKPTVEIMAALPTVILGFLAGLWLAPVMETHLAGVFLVLFALPVVILVFGFLWSRAPAALRHLVPEGWDAALLVPVLLLAGWGVFSVGPYLELAFFNGNMPQWVTNELGFGFDQRNALVVGIAMGFAVIPNIFSIAEDAIFGVPKHLSYGSLALGATPWQTLVRVVLPTASPGIFSALMIGLGRAVGETMIVLMATGNTPILNMNIFEGMRTLSANIAVEMPESEVASTHFRVLFLAALVLFLFTFVLNTGAEIIRQRLRNKYSNI